MIHIKDIIDRIAENASKAKFYSHNQQIFLKYFDSEEQYKALILAGNFKKLEAIISEKSEFKFSKRKNEIIKN